MPTKKDLVEAHAYSRRRLITAFVSGAPGGREVEPTRPGRTIVGGIALSVLLIAGAAIAGVFTGRTPADWFSPGLVLSKETGAPYVVIESDGELTIRPVVNITSARLLVGADSSPTTVPQTEIDRRQVGDYIGIPEAPATLPGPDLMIDRGWTACLGVEGGLRASIALEPGVEILPTAAAVAQVDGEHHLIVRSQERYNFGSAQTFSLRLPDNDVVRSRMLSQLGQNQMLRPREVPRDWLTLFQPGPRLDLDSFGLQGRGEPVSYARDLGGIDAAIGDLVRIGNQAFLLQHDGPAELTPFAEIVYRALTGVEPRDLTEIGRAYVAGQYPAEWPQVPPTEHAGEWCALLEPRAADTPQVWLAMPRPAPGGGAPSAEGPSARDVPAGVRQVRVEPGHGARVTAGGWDFHTGGSEFVIDPRGIRYELIGDAGDLLGYAAHQPRLVPDTWLTLFDQGVPLSQQAATCTPGRGSDRC
ncbi:type VII secretion protein EccB [Nocardioides limicola]|uniref:type VII secretion protein EccB n=1 Tax=Nocardioides limicola TaxID=2803368 RepID=UPI00193BCE79|nr:type VII secretion protein EccB [Nocardioides sp. DJM-14]